MAVTRPFDSQTSLSQTLAVIERGHAACLFFLRPALLTVQASGTIINMHKLPILPIMASETVTCNLACLTAWGWGKQNSVGFMEFQFEMAPNVSVNFISLVTSCVRLRKEEHQTAFPVSFTWVSHIAASVLMGR